MSIIFYGIMRIVSTRNLLYAMASQMGHLKLTTSRINVRLTFKRLQRQATVSDAKRGAGLFNWEDSTHMKKSVEQRLTISERQLKITANAVSQ